MRAAARVISISRYAFLATVVSVCFLGVSQVLAADQVVMQARVLVKLKGCGRSVVQVPATLRLEEPPRWTLGLDGSELAGTYVAKGRRKRKLLLETNAAGLAALAARAASRATILCGAPTGVATATLQSFKVVRRKQNRARVALVARFTGGTTDKPGRLILRGNGTLEPAPTTTTSTTLVSQTSTTASPSTTLLLPSTTTTTTSSQAPSTTTPTNSTTTEPIPSTTTTSTNPSTSTTVTTVSSTTTTTDACAAIPDEVHAGCLPDENPCTADVCRGGVCTHDTPQGSFVTCRPANGTPCDTEDHCGGTTCPDSKKLVGSLCTPLVAAQYPCNLGGFLSCDGIHEFCPTERLCLNTEACSADQQCFSQACYQGVCVDKVGAGGSCDSAPDCADGLTCNTGTCVTDTATDCMGVPAGTPCRPAVDTCDVAEFCTGESPSCPPDTFAPADTPCRLNQGACDLADVCTGTFAGCPDRIAASGAPCGLEATGPCHPVQETCNGVSKACPTPVYLPCQPSQGPCDIVDSCDPATNPNFPNCPPDMVVPNGTPCGTPPSDCQERICNGVTYTCATMRARPADYVCRPAVDDCDAPEQCGGLASNINWPACRDDLAQPDGTSCNTVPDGLLGMCSAGQCVPETCKYDVDCEDGKVCNQATWHCVTQASGQGSACTGQAGSIIGTCTGGLVCCAGLQGDGVGGYAGAGQTGRCAQCCGNQQSTIDDCNDPQLECCDGRCINVGTNDRFCGGCTPRSNAGFGTGEDCIELENACSTNGHCSFGVCSWDSTCANPDDVCTLPNAPCPDPITLECFANPPVDPDCLTGWPDFPGCTTSCGPYQVPNSVLSPCLNHVCNSDDDCACEGVRCRTTCGDRDYGFCDFQNTCQPVAE
jgi:hypothetical protein